jgi:hypothetical protein
VWQAGLCGSKLALVSPVSSEWRQQRVDSTFAGCVCYGWSAVMFDMNGEG